MEIFTLPPSLLGLLALVAAASAQVDPQLVGTWTTSSRKVFTGPEFYDPVNDRFSEPALPGISYSFTADGYYEEAYYRANSNPSNPKCPSGIMQWQHGEYTKAANGSLILIPLAVDGRQLLSSPCDGTKAVYTRYTQPEVFRSYAVHEDKYHGVLRLDLYQFDGSPMNAMYLAYQPPQMLPTQTLNPTATGSNGAATPTTTANRKRSFVDMADFEPSIDVKAMQEPDLKKRSEMLNPDRWWWIGIGMTAMGSLGYFLL